MTYQMTLLTTGSFSCSRSKLANSCKSI